MLSIGLMSGTSMDGIDAALIETDGTPNLIKELGDISIPYVNSFQILLKIAEYSIRKCQGDLAQAKLYCLQAISEYLLLELNIPQIQLNDKIAELSSYLYGPKNSNCQITLDEIILHSTYLHSLAVKKLLVKTGYLAQSIDVIGYHGQTMFHSPLRHISVAIGQGQYLADQMGIAVINDFRRRDVALGGQGAPFAPLYHQALAIRDKKIPLAVVNCGGIANITLIKNSHELDLIAFDTGPGNGLIDKLIRLRTQGKEQMDMNGQYGKKGTVDPQVLNVLYEKTIIQNDKNYFSMLPPKSLDIGDMTLIPELFMLSIEDACATLEAFTADTIVRSLELTNTDLPYYWVLAGGGWNNPVIRQELENRLFNTLGSKVKVFTANDVGWNNQAMEAQIFAYLAVRSLQNKPLSVPGTTRISEPLSGGHAYVPSVGSTKQVEKLIEMNPLVLKGYQ